MRMTASWFGSLDPPDTRLRHDCFAPACELPSYRHPDRTKRAVVLEAVKVWPGKSGACRTAVQRPTLTAPARADVSKVRVGTKRSNKETDEEKKMCGSETA